MALFTSSKGSSASAARCGMVCSHSSLVVSGQGPAHARLNAHVVVVADWLIFVEMSY